MRYKRGELGTLIIECDGEKLSVLSDYSAQLLRFGDHLEVPNISNAFVPPQHEGCMVHYDMNLAARLIICDGTVLLSGRMQWDNDLRSKLEKVFS